MGDSGAPMVIDSALVGTSSYYQNCLGDEYPDLFTRVDRFTNWILEVAASGNARKSGFRDAPVVM